MKKILLSLMALMAVASVSSQTLKQTFDEATTLYGEKKFAEAATKLETVIIDGMDDESSSSMVATAKTYLPKCYFMMGGLAAKGGNFDVARENFSKSAEKAELYDDMATMVKANTWIGKTYELQGGNAFNAKKYAEALPIFENGYASDPRNAKMANWLGICYCETGNFEKGLEVFSKVAAMGSNSKYAEEAAAAQQHSANYTINQVAKLQESKNYDGVIKMADGILAKDPKNATAAKVRLQAYSDKKAYDKVFELADSAAAIQPSVAEKSSVYFILGAAYNAREMKDQAIETFKKVTSGPNAAAAKATITELTTPAK